MNVRIEKCDEAGSKAKEDNFIILWNWRPSSLSFTVLPFSSSSLHMALWRQPCGSESLGNENISFHLCPQLMLITKAIIMRWLKSYIICVHLFFIYFLWKWSIFKLLTCTNFWNPKTPCEFGFLGILVTHIAPLPIWFIGCHLQPHLGINLYNYF